MVFTQGPSAHLGSLATGLGLGTIFSNSGIVRFVQGGVVKTFRYPHETLGMDAERPPADQGRTEIAMQHFSLGLTADEYAARHAHEWGCFSLDEVRYADAKLDDWIQRLGDIFFRRNNAPTIDELRDQYLSPIERAAVQRRENEPF